MQLVPSKPTFVVLGDSAAFGTGDEIATGKFRGWAGFVAEAFQDGCEYFNFSRPGAKSSEVVEIQLPKALALSPDICAVIVGSSFVGCYIAKLDQSHCEACHFRQLSPRKYLVSLVAL